MKMTTTKMNDTSISSPNYEWHRQQLNLRYDIEFKKKSTLIDRDLRDIKEKYARLQSKAKPEEIKGIKERRRNELTRNLDLYEKWIGVKLETYRIELDGLRYPCLDGCPCADVRPNAP